MYCYAVCKVNGTAQLMLFTVGVGKLALTTMCGGAKLPIAPPKYFSSLTRRQQRQHIIHIHVYERNHNPKQSNTMPSRGNPNVPNKSRRVSSRRKVQKKNAVNKISKNPRGTAKSSVLHPTSGPLAPVSSKKARKLEKAANHARQRAIGRAMEQEGEVIMTG